MPPASSPKGSEAASRILADIDRRSPVPLYEQIASRLKAAIASRVLAAGTDLPSVRRLALDLGLNAGTVVQAYRSLESDGFVEIRQGAGTFVRGTESDQGQRELEAQARALIRHLLAEAGKRGVGISELRASFDELTKRR